VGVGVKVGGFGVLVRVKVGKGEGVEVGEASVGSTGWVGLSVGVFVSGGEPAINPSVTVGVDVGSVFSSLETAEIVQMKATIVMRTPTPCKAG
jgi:hypothetical protein